MAEEKKPDAPEAAAAPDAAAAEAKPNKKKKLIMFGGIGVGVIAIALGAFFMMKPKAKLAAKANGVEEDAGHGDKKDAGHGDKKDDGHGDKKDDGHGDKKDDGHGAAPAKDDGHGDKKDDGHGAAPAKDDGHGGAAPAKKDDKAAPKYAEVFALPHQDLNLGNPIENRYLRLTIGLEYRGGEEQAEELKRRQSQFTDIMISTISNKTRLELLTEIGKNKLRRELVNKFNEISERPISAIYFTEFVVE